MAVQGEDERLVKIRDVLRDLPSPHFRYKNSLSVSLFLSLNLSLSDSLSLSNAEMLSLQNDSIH